jgi:hypothetical protein
MDKKETIADYPLPFENEKGGQIEAKLIVEDENLSVKFKMAIELQTIGLSDEAISRQLNINYHRR